LITKAANRERPIREKNAISVANDFIIVLFAEPLKFAHAASAAAASVASQTQCYRYSSFIINGQGSNSSSRSRCTIEFR